MEKTADTIIINEDNSIILNLGLCVGRHELPTDDCIFQEIINPTDTDGLENEAKKSILKYTAGRKLSGVNIYVTGLTVALAASVNAIKNINPDCKIVLFHYDRDNGNYYSQPLK